jgi:ESX secretion system protein EccE
MTEDNIYGAPRPRPETGSPWSGIEHPTVPLGDGYSLWPGASAVPAPGVSGIEAMQGTLPPRGDMPISGAGVPPPGRPAPTRPAPSDLPRSPVKALRRPGHIGSLSITQIVVAEVAVLVFAAVATRGLVPGLIAGVAGAAVLLFAFARRRQRWWLEDRWVAWQHRRRQSAALDNGSGPMLAALRTLAPGFSVRDVSTADGIRAGVARDEAGWFTVVALTPTAPMHREAAPIPVDALVRVLAEADQPGVVLQLVTHTVPAPSLGLHPASLAGSSYRQLTGLFGPVSMPAHRESAVAVRLDARILAEALLDHTTDLDAAAALVASLGRRVATSLRRLGISSQVLDAEEVLRTMGRYCDLEAGVLGDTNQVREEWSEWHSARLAHRTYWLKTWPSSAEEIGPLFEWVAAIPAAQSTVTLILDPSGEDEVAARALIRVAAPPEALANVTENLTAGVRRAGGELFPLDGEQGPGVYATAPTGGGAG